MPADVSFTDMYRAGVVPDFGVSGGSGPAGQSIPQLQANNEVYEVRHSKEGPFSLQHEPDKNLWRVLRNCFTFSTLFALIQADILCA